MEKLERKLAKTVIINHNFHSTQLHKLIDTSYHNQAQKKSIKINRCEHLTILLFLFLSTSNNKIKYHKKSWKWNVRFYILFKFHNFTISRPFLRWFFSDKYFSFFFFFPSHNKKFHWKEMILYEDTIFPFSFSKHSISFYFMNENWKLNFQFTKKKIHKNNINNKFP